MMKEEPQEEELTSQAQVYGGRPFAEKHSKTV